MRVSGSMPSIGYAIRASQSGKTAVPVSQANYIYSHFRHVSGVPAADGSRGVAITRMKVLDVLIDQLAQMKKKPEINVENINPSDDRLDALITQYEGQIKAARVANSIMPYAPAPSAPAGVLFSLSA